MTATVTSPPALIPERTTPDGPVTTNRLRRTVTRYGLLAAAGTVLSRAAGDRTAANAALGLVAPGAGFLSAGRPVTAAATQGAFAASLVAWLGSGNVLAPISVWGASAALSARFPVRWPRAATLVPLVAAGGVAAVAAVRKRGFGRAVARRERRNEYLRAKGAVSVPRASVQVRPSGTPQVGELSADQLAHARFALDRALQPVESFDGFDRIEQFQTASLRYQVNCVGYALAGLQYGYTPAFHGYLNLAQRNVIAKAQERVCWAFWAKESLWGHLSYNPDPIPRDNIMVSGWLGYQIAGYVSNTLDDRYSKRGSISFKHPSGRSFDYDLHSITEILARNFSDSEFGLFPCEPNWIYALCNGFGILPLPIHDRLFGTDYAEKVYPSFLEGFENEFMSADGRTIGLRSKWTGLTVPAMTSLLSDASVIWQLNPVFPDLARRQWEVLRHEYVSLRDGELALRASGWDRIDTGNYKPSTISAALWVQAAAGEVGDLEVAEAAGAYINRVAPPTTIDGVRRYRSSVQGNLGILMATCSRPNAHSDRINRGLPDEWAHGPVLEDASYPEVLVARAVSDGAALDLVLRPGVKPGRRRLGVSRLRPGARYAVIGSVVPDVTADADGNATFDVDLTGRTEVRLVPAG